MYKISKINKEVKRANIFKRILEIILYIIIIPIIIFNFIMIIESVIQPNNTPNLFGYKSFVIVSRSMEPFIMKGDMIIVKEVKQDELKVNDIISFQDDEAITTHRIKEIVNKDGIIQYKTKGDNNNVEDKGTVTFEKIEGKYQFKINKFGNVLEIFKSKITLFILIGIVFFNYLYSKKLKNKKEERKRKRIKYNQEKEE